MDTSAATELAATIQSASINPAPSILHDASPATAASGKVPVKITRRPSHLSSPPSSPSQIPIVARPIPRRSGPHMPPLPDLRFEQSYLASIPADASNARIAWITVRDHLFAPLAQGFGWSLILMGWRHWNRGSQLVGSSLGARIRRWWWRVNHWDVHADTTVGGKGKFDDRKVGEYYTSQLGAGGD